MVVTGPCHVGEVGVAPSRLEEALVCLGVGAYDRGPLGSCDIPHPWKERKNIELRLKKLALKEWHLPLTAENLI